MAEGVLKEKPALLSNWIQMLQLGTLIIGLIMVSGNMGAKGQQLDDHGRDLRELKEITQNLVKYQIGAAKDLDFHKDLLERIDARVRALEGAQK